MSFFEKWLTVSKPIFSEENNYFRRKTIVYDLSKNLHEEYEDTQRSNAQFISQLNQQDFRFLLETQKAYGKPKDLQNNDVYGKIVTSFYDLMYKTRKNPIKFAKDLAYMQNDPNAGDYAKTAQMQKSNFNKNVTIYILTNSGTNKILPYGTNAVNVEFNNVKFMIVPARMWEKLPDTSNPLGILTPQGKEVVSHEAGHNVQNIDKRKFSSRFIDPNDYDAYLNLPQEFGTRLAKLKNINSETMLLKYVNQIYPNNKNIIEQFKSNLPKDEIERVLMFVNYFEKVKNQMPLNGFDTVVGKLITYIEDNVDEAHDIKTLFEHFRNRIKINPNELKQQIRKTYPGLAMNYGQQQSQYASSQMPSQSGEVSA